MIEDLEWKGLNLPQTWAQRSTSLMPNSSLGEARSVDKSFFLGRLQHRQDPTEVRDQMPLPQPNGKLINLTNRHPEQRR